MISAARLHRLALAIVKGACATDSGEPMSPARERELLADFAGVAELDHEDFSTLLRVAAGEAPAGHRSPGE